MSARRGEYTRACGGDGDGDGDDEGQIDDQRYGEMNDRMVGAGDSERDGDTDSDDDSDFDGTAAARSTAFMRYVPPVVVHGYCSRYIPLGGVYTGTATGTASATTTATARWTARRHEVQRGRVSVHSGYRAALLKHKF